MKKWVCHFCLTWDWKREILGSYMISETFDLWRKTRRRSVAKVRSLAEATEWMEAVKLWKRVVLPCFCHLIHSFLVDRFSSFFQIRERWGQSRERRERWAKKCECCTLGQRHQAQHELDELGEGSTATPKCSTRCAAGALGSQRPISRDWPHPRPKQSKRQDLQIKNAERTWDTWRIMN